ncbi:low affinity iron permease family protein [Pseudobacter ginsenosidimutans]|jgi:low affinity Fe/Cu permease|uniref:Low affinity Fe/Cu permease n=1 Tax=Pseudobacter ginsenosidimutans TaxID=661488 RepID=A0A4Q7MYT1_9BACT|nr:low affinity iron permease family protein [Pseudobacter ginsenosidimutans]QEC43046.1 low affinity iron permease family protein [Pseudobacter ginsenosidimutans]RZS74400.1 low affinity Fe/Cu permease [Pseudobacter ginsenosidimutans]
MKKKKKNSPSKLFTRISTAVTKAAGRPVAFICAALVVVCWAILGPVFNYSDTWQLVINTGTTIITFLMVFVIQQSQNRDTLAIQLKLNELIASHAHASNRLVDIEDLTEEELAVIKKFYIRLSKLAGKEVDLHATHSIDEAEENHQKKSKDISKNPGDAARNNSR